MRALSPIPISQPILSEKHVVLQKKTREVLAKKLSTEQMQVLLSMNRKVKVTRIQYESNDKAITGFTVMPKKVSGELPCIIYNRGGFKDFGSLKVFHLFTELGLLASWGYVVVASQYSGNDGSDGKDEFGGADVEDVLALREVLATCKNANVRRIGMYGVSRGGMMAYRTMATCDWIKAVVTVGAITDLDRIRKLRPAMMDVFKEAFGGTAKGIKERSAVRWADKLCTGTPLHMLYGNRDERVSPQDGLDLATALQKNGHPYQLTIINGGDHSLSAHAEEKWKNTKKWFEKYL